MILVTKMPYLGVLQTPKDGIDMIPDLRYRFTMKVVRLSDTMCLVQDY